MTNKSIEPSTETNSSFMKFIITTLIIAAIISISILTIIYSSLDEESKNLYQNKVVQNLKETKNCEYVDWALSLKGRNFVGDIVKEAEIRLKELNC